MSLHAVLSLWLPPRMAGVLTAVVYAGLVVAILLLTPLAPAPFHYGRY